MSGKPVDAMGALRRTADGATRTLAQAHRELSPFFVDALAVGLAWILVTYAVSWFAFGSEKAVYFLVPWWIVLVGSIETAVLWESFGVSLGHTLFRVRLLGASRRKPTTARSLVRVLTWHVSVFPLVGLVLRPSLHERLSGLSLQPFVAEPGAPKRWYRRSTGIYVAFLLVVIGAGAVGVTITVDNLVRLFTDAWRVAPIWKALVSPNLAILRESLSDLVVTIFMAIMATLFAAILAVPLSFFAARNLTRGVAGRLAYTILRGVMSIFRSIEPIVWAIVFLVWVTSEHASFAGLLALWVHSIADLTKLYAERLESIDEGLLEAITATGAGRLQVLRYGVVPQIVNPYISFTLYRFDINVRMATVVGLVGAGGIGQRLIAYLSGQRYPNAGTVMLLIVLAVWAIDYLSSRLRSKLN
ncbi:MAG: phosphonate ABC transporter, permease protein PhnE [Candidatus Bipolaricaulota bacterium]